jgi:DtxR family Mn-dependent transcriptional regulator
MPDYSKSIQDYLKTIYGLSRSDGSAQTGELAEALSVAPGSVSGMLRRLADAELVEHTAYRGVTLTDRGRDEALRVIRRHRVLETYLVEVLGLAWDLVHEEAERLEHAASDQLIDRMAEALGNPRFDPHGAPIPTADGDVESEDLIPLTEVPVGGIGEVRQVRDDDADRLRYVASLGLRVGTRFEVLDAAPFRGPVTIRGVNATAKPQVIGFELAQSLLSASLKKEVAR